MDKPIVKEFINLVQIDSPSRDERRVADYLIERFAEFGISLEEDDAGKKIGGSAGNLLGLLPGDDREPLLFCAHMDTVRSNLGMEVAQTDGLLHTKEHKYILGADDKAGVAAIIELIRLLVVEKRPHPPIEIFFSIAEESGLWGAKHVDVSKLRSKAGFVLDSGGPIGNIVHKAPVHNEFTIKVYGRAAHAGANPESGINAIQIAAKIVAGISLGRIDEYTTANIGRISGGEADNIVPDLAVLNGEVRSHKPDHLEAWKERLTRTVARVSQEYHGKAEVIFAESFPALQLDSELRVVKVASEAALKSGLQPNLVATGGGSDANILNGKGISVANLSNGSYGAHSSEEHIAIEDLEKLSKYLLAITEEW